MIKTRTWAAVISVIFILSAACAAWLWLRPSEGRTASIYVDGKLVRTVDLASLDAPVTFTVDTGRGVNTVTAEPGRIRVSDADCPDRVCVEFGWLNDSSAPIVCLPHRLVIRLTDGPSGPVDAIAG